MPYRRLPWKFKLFLMIIALLIDLVILYIKYTEPGHLPRYMIMATAVSFIVVCLLIVSCDRSWEKYYMNKEDSSDKDYDQ